MASRAERRLAAILAADVVGYSRLMGEDEAGTHARLKACRKELVEPLVTEYHGRVVKLTGDGALVEFGSAVDAVECAVAIQRGMTEHEMGEPDGRRLRFRIGINIGDIILEEGDIYGEGVNVAVRLEGLAEPGGICLARSVYNQVKGKLAVALEPMGEHQVKNIAEPVETYRVALDGVAAAPRPAAAGRRAPRRLLMPALGAAAVLVVLGAVWQFWPGAPPAEGRPGIAVLPFNNFGGDEATGRLADGITEDIITDLARFNDLDVIARNSTELYKGKPVDVRQVGKDLNVGYVLEGSIQRQGENIRVTGQLIDARTGAHVWSDRWDRPAEDVFAVQTEVAENVAAALGGDLTMGEITRAEIQRAKRLRPNDLTAYDYFQLGKESKATFSNIDQGIDHLTKAVTLDPQLARAYSVRAWLHNFSIGFGEDATTALQQMISDAEKAVALDPRDCESLATLAYARGLVQGRWAEAEPQFRSAVEMCPANSHTLILAATGFSFIGKAEEGAGFADRALRLDPRMTPANLSGAKDAFYTARRYEDTIDAVMRMPEEHRGRDSWVMLAGSYARLGRTEEGIETSAKVLAAFPNVSAERMVNEDYAYAREEDQEFFVDGFRVAGLPVCMSAAEIAQFPALKPVAGCDAERARAVAARS